MTNKIRVRLAPSPTGHLHIGTAQSAVYNWLFAQKHGGDFVLRIEDTDKERSKKEYEDEIIDGLRWLGLDWAEFHRQSERNEVYSNYIKKLLDSGHAFWCYHTKEELENEQKEQMADSQAPRHVCNHKFVTAHKPKDGVIRLAASKSHRTIMFNDEIRGQISWDQDLLGDFVIAKDLNNALYNLAVVVDDIEMKISHVIRGEDHISNTPKQILIYEALKAKVPVFAHLPLILASDRSKLSKRHGATAIADYKKDYLPEAMVNFLGALSYTFSEEIISKEEMADQFELSKVHRSGAVFDIKKLNWINSQYIKKLSADELREVTGISEIDDGFVPVITERIDKLSDVNELSYLWKDFDYDKDLLIWKNSDVEKTKKALEEVKNIISADDLKPEELKLKLDELSDKKFGGDKGLVYWPFRVALSGKEKSANPLELYEVKGSQSSIISIDKAIDKLK